MKKHNIIMLIIAFLLPFFILLAAFVALRITPFGSQTLIFGDSDGYYINYLVYIREVLLGNHSTFYAFNKGIGGSVAHLSSFYLYRIDTLFYLLAGYEYLAEAFCASVIFNSALCGLTMYLLLARLFGHKSSNLIFSTSYALMGFITVNNYNVVFAMGPVLLPLMLLGLYQIYKGESPLLYIFSLAYSILTLFQMGFILCTASVIFFAYLWLFSDESSGLNSKRLIVRYSLSSLSAGLLGAVVWLPALKALMGRVSQTNANDYEMIDTVPILQMGARLFSGAASTSQLIDGFPAVFCGIFPLLLLILFFLNKEISKKEKIGAGVLLGIYILSFYIKAINNIFQGFGHVNWFNYRQSFVFTFIILLIATKEFEYIDSLTLTEIKKGVAILAIFGLLVFVQKYEFISGANVVFDFIILGLICGFITFYKLKPEKADYRSLVLIIMICTCSQLYFNYYFSVHKVIKAWGQEVDAFQDDITRRLPLASGIQEADKDFYRLENENQRTINDPMMFSYNGVSHMSYENSDVLKNVHKLGVSWMGVQGLYYDKGITASMDSFLGLRYLISKRDLSLEKGYIALGEIGENTIYRNPYALPIAIISDSKVSEVSLESDKDIFELQNQIWKGMTGETDSLFTREESFNVAVHNPTENVEMTSGEVLELAELLKISDNAEQESSEKESLEQDNPEDIWKDSKDDNTIYDEVGNEVYPNNAYIEISFPAQMSGPVYMYDSAAVVDNYGTSEDVLKYLGNYEVGDIVTGRIYYNYNVDKVILADTIRGLYVYYADMEKLSKYSQILQSRPVTITKEKDTILTGNADIQDGEILLFTIPYDEGWSLYVDGQKAQIDKTMDLLMSAAVTSGQHNYELRYTAPGLKLGIAMSILAAIITLIQFVLYRRGRIWVKSDQVEE